MSKNPEEMTDEELEAAQRAADGESQEVDPIVNQEEETPTEAEGDKPKAEPEKPEEAAEQTAASEAQTSAVAEEGKVAGVATKDGSKVLPYGALQAARRDARRFASKAERAEQEAARLKEELENLRAGRVTESTELTEDEVARLEEDFPELGKKARAALDRVKALEQQVAAARPKQADTEDDPVLSVQEAIDEVPLLVEWQSNPEHAEKFARAVEHDALLERSPKWRDKPAVERFKEAARRTAEEFDIPVDIDKPSSSAPSKASTTAPKAAPTATRTPPTTLSDLKGGSVPDHGQISASMPASRLLGRYMDMSPEDIDRELARLG